LKNGQIAISSGTDGCGNGLESVEA